MESDYMMSDSTNRKDDHFYFGAIVAEPLVLRKKMLRSELKYDADVFAEKTALKYIERISESFDGSIYLLTASQDIAQPSKVRTKKGVLWQEKELRRLDSRNLELDVSDGKTRLVSLVNLNGFNYDASEVVVLNWIFSLVILSTMDIDALSSHVKGWLSKGDKGVLVYNYDAVAKDLISLDSTVALRYFPADNDRCEMLVVVGNRDFIEENVEVCINSIS
jgi:hypothetical protein